MKKLMYAMLLVLATGLFSSCQKGENFFLGTWQAVGTYSIEDKNGDYYQDVYTIELTIEKSNSVKLSVNYPKDPKNNISRTGTYKFYNDNTIAVTFPETRDDDEIVSLMYKLKEGNQLYCDWLEASFTKVKNK